MPDLPAASSPEDIARLIAARPDPGPAAAPPPAPAPGAAPENVWEEARRLSGSTRRLRAILDDLRLISLAEATAVVKTGTLAALARTAKAEIEDVLSRAAGRRISLAFQSDDPARDPGPTRDPAPDGPGPAPAAPPAMPPVGTPAPAADPRQHPLVRRAEELLNARVVRVEARQRPPS